MTTEDTAIELFSLLDNIDTLSDVCKDDDKLFRTLAMREAAKRYDYATTDGYKVKLKTGVKSIDEPAADCTYKPTYALMYYNKEGQLVYVEHV